jgi:hypothetical protein
MNDTDYTVVALNDLANIEPIVLVDDNSPLNTEDTRIRFVHASLDAPAVDIAVSGGPILFSDIEFKEVGDYLEVGAGTYDLEVLATGTSTVALDLPGIDISEGAVYTVFAVGYLNPPMPTTTTTTTDDTTPMMTTTTTTDADTPGFGLFAMLSLVIIGSIYRLRKRK